MSDEGKKYSREHYTLLISQCFSSDAVAGLALRELDGVGIKKCGASSVQAVLFDIIREYFNKHKVLPDAPTLRAEVGTACTEFYFSEKQSAKLHKELTEIIEIASQVEEKKFLPLAKEMVATVASEAIFKPAVKELLATPSQTGELGDLVQQLGDISRAQNRVSMSGNVQTGIFSEEDEAGLRMTTGLPLLDSMFGEGAGPVTGSLLGIVAPQGCGKTTLGIAIAVAQALLGRHVLLVLAEEGRSKTFNAKLAGAATGIPYEEIARKGIQQAIEESPQDKMLLRKKLAMVNEHLHTYDMVSTQTIAGGAEAIAATVEDLDARGKKPVYVYVDWAGPIATAIEGSEGGRRNRTTVLYDLSNDLYVQAQRFDNIYAISQQMSPSRGAKDPFVIPDVYCAADCTMFTAPMKYAIVLGQRHNQSGGYQVLTVIKCRDDAVVGMRVPIKLEGEIPRIVDMSGRLTIQGNSFRPKHRRGDDSTDNSMKLPKERPETSSVEVE